MGPVDVMLWALALLVVAFVARIVWELLFGKREED